LATTSETTEEHVQIDPHPTDPGPTPGPTAPETDGIEGRLDDLRCDLFETPLSDSDGPLRRRRGTHPAGTPAGAPSCISYAELDLDLDLKRKRMAIWEIFMTHIRAGAGTWPEVQRALTPEDLTRIVQICDGRPLRDLLVTLR
jgi:hypothetical protein